MCTRDTPVTQESQGEPPIPQFSGFPSMRREDGIIFGGDMYLNIYVDDSNALQVDVHMLNDHPLGFVKKRFFRQVVGEAKLLGYIEGPPPVPGENTSINMTQFNATSSGTTLGVTTVQKSRQIINTEASRSYYGSSQTTQDGHSISGGYSTLLGVGVATTAALWANAGFQTETSDSSRRATASTFSQDTYSYQTEYSCRMVGAMSCIDPGSETGNRPNMPPRMLPLNQGTFYVSVEVQNEFVEYFNGRVIGVTTEDMATGPRRIELILPFPLNPKYRIVGTLDGTIGYQAMDLRKPFIHPSLRDRLTTEVYETQGAHESYANVIQASTYRVWASERSDYEAAVVKSRSEPKGVFTAQTSATRDIESAPIDRSQDPHGIGTALDPGKNDRCANYILGQEFGTKAKMASQTASELREEETTKGGIAQDTKTLALLFPSLLQRTSILVGQGSSRTGQSSSSRSVTEIMRDLYDIHSERRGSMGGTDAQLSVIKHAYSGATDYDYVCEMSQNAEVCVQYSSAVTNGVNDDILDEPTHMSMCLQGSFVTTSFYVGQNIPLTASLRAALFPYDRTVVAYYEQQKKRRCVGVWSSDGLMLCAPNSANTLEPLVRPGVVRSYQYDTLLLTQHPDSFNEFFDTVADPAWVATNPLAIQLQSNSAQTESPDRVMHFVNYVQRNTALFANSTEEMDQRPNASVDLLVNVGGIDSYPGNSLHDMGLTIVPWSSIDCLLFEPVNIGYVIELHTTHSEVVGCLVTSGDGRFRYAIVKTGDVRLTTQNNEVWAKNRVSAPDVAVYLFQRHIQRYVDNQSTRLVDARVIEMGSLSSTFIMSNTWLLDHIRAVGPFSDDVPNTVATMVSMIQHHPNKENLALVLFYYFYARQAQAYARFVRSRTPEVMSQPAAITKLTREHVPTRLVLEVDPDQTLLTITCSTDHQLTSRSWWGICHDDDTSMTSFLKWVSYGYVSHAVVNGIPQFDQHDPETLATTTDHRIIWSVDVSQLVKRGSYKFVLFYDDADETKSIEQGFHPKISTRRRESDVFDWRHEEQVRRSANFFAYARARALSTTETRIEILDILNTEYQPHSISNHKGDTIISDIRYNENSDTPVYFVRELSSKGLSIFMQPGYYTIVLNFPGRPSVPLII
jgi:hypothetical protein